MAQVNIDLVQKNTDSILEIVGKQSFVNWEQFTVNSSEVARHIDELNSTLNMFREIQHKNFIQTMKKLKNYDLPDILQAVQAKKLPKQALRGVLGRFKLNGQKLELVEAVDSLKENAATEYALYKKKNDEIVENLKKFIGVLNQNIQKSGLLPEKMPQLQKIKSTVKFTISEDKATKLASAIDIQYLAGTKQLISFKTYSQLVDSTLTLIKDEYKNLTENTRKRQRELMSNHPEYFKCIHEYLNNCEALISEGQALLAAKIGLSEEKIGESEMALMERGMGENVLMAQTQLRAKVKESVGSQKDVTTEVAKETIRYQVEMIETKGSEINSILNGLPKGPETIQMVPMLLALILNDYVYEKFGYEEEDYMKNLGESILQDQQFNKIFMEMQMGIMKLMQSLDCIPPEIAEIMKQQQAMEQMGMGMGGGMGGMGMPGMGPQPPVNQTSNPFDMLQNQQMQQMQQMFGGMQPPK